MALIILATISINAVFGENGIIKRVEASKGLHEKSKAEEQLALTLENATIEKRVNKRYDQNEFLDDFILDELPDAKIKGDIVIINEYAFELDRSVPQIGKYTGKKEELVFSNVEVNAVVAEDSKTATITITTIEKEKGIRKIEIIQNGYVIKEYPYENIKEEIKEEFIVKQNGKYTIKVYGNLISTEKTIVEGLVASVEYSPNGNEEYKKEHEVTIKVAKDTQKVKSMKYQWLQTTAEPAANTFTEICHNNETITGKGYTGTYYLWVLLETTSGKTNVCRSEGFNFDNEGPTVNLSSTPVSENSFTLTATAQDEYSEISKYEFYVDGKIVSSQESNIFIWTGSEMFKGTSSVKVYDKAGNYTETNTNSRTKLHFWGQYELQPYVEGYLVKNTISNKSVTKSDCPSMCIHHNKKIYDPYSHQYAWVKPAGSLSISANKQTMNYSLGSGDSGNSGNVTWRWCYENMKTPFMAICFGGKDVGLYINSISDDGYSYKISGYAIEWIDPIPERTKRKLFTRVVFNRY